jgi:dienelactone hydrolase
MIEIGCHRLPPEEGHIMRTVLPLIFVVSFAGFLGTACGGDPDDTSSGTSSSSSSGTGGSGGGVAFCQGATAVLYDPLAKSLQAFPDDFFTVDDPATKTGLRVATVPDQDVVLPASAAPFSNVFADLSVLDGFGTTAGMNLIFTGPLDPQSLPPNGAGSGMPTDSIVLVNLDSATTELLPIDWELTPETDGNPQTTLTIWSQLPLAPQTRYGLAVTTRVKDMSGGCIAPPPTMQELLGATATDPKLTRLAGRYADLMQRLTDAGTITGPADLSAATVFTTQHTVEDSIGIATHIRTKTHPYTSAGPCVDPADPMAPYRVCEGEFPADDYRVNNRGVDENDLTPKASYTLKVTTYLPKMGAPPYPTMIYGHGLGGDRHQAERLAQLAAPDGYATIAIDAVKHGEHPDAPGGTGILAIADFFALSLGATNPLDPVELRDHFRQSTYDKLQLVEMLRPGVDIDGDSMPDVDTNNLIYLGVSLGGIMASEFVALTPEVQVAIPIVPGARVVNIIKDSASFSPIIGLLAGMSTPGDQARFFPIIQTVVDRGDPGSYTAHIARNRLPGFDSAAPEVLMQMVIADDTVPNLENAFFARGLGLPHVGDELLSLGTIQKATLPLTGNIDATHTGGVFEYDLVYTGTGPMTEAATHSNVADNPVAILQTLHFIDTHFTAGVAEIIDPYKELAIKP